MKVRHRLFFGQTVTREKNRGVNNYNLLKIHTLSLSLCDTLNCLETVTCHRLSPPLLWKPEEAGRHGRAGEAGCNTYPVDRVTIEE